MRNLISLLGVVMALFGAGVGNTVRAAAPLEPVPPQPPTPVPAQVVSVGESVLFTLTEHDWYQTFELTAPSDGTLLVSIDDLSGGIGIFIDGIYPPYNGFATHEVVAGQTYLIEIAFLYWELLGVPDTPVVLTTSLSLVPLILPPRCLTIQPRSDWVCVTGGNWVPPDHAAAEGAFTFPQPGLPVPMPPISPPSLQDGASGCPSIRPGPDWVCLAAGIWVRPDHPLALPPATAIPLPTPPTPPAGCTTPDPFAAIPGMIGVCIGNNTWVPLGHPLAGGGG